MREQFEKLKKHIEDHKAGYIVAVSTIATAVFVAIVSNRGERYPYGSSYGDDNVGELLVVDLDQLPDDLVSQLREAVGPTVKVQSVMEIEEVV